MESKNSLFSIEHEGKTYVVIQAADARQAVERAPLVSHIVPMPVEYGARPLPPVFWLRTPVFYEGHFQAIADAMKQFGR